jgi:GNAT superfamily N-acetyltransferase
MRTDIDSLNLRSAVQGDLRLLLSMIRSLAAFEKLSVESTEESLRTALFSDPPLAHALLAFVNGEPAGYATYFFTFASMRDMRGLWLDDLYVVPRFRGQGVGRAIMAHVADIAMRHECGKMEWIVLDWNEIAIGFYRRLGAKMLSDWKICRLERAQIAGILSEESESP